jgi:glutamate/tyrosine decarboxylase-like PLP-dependent enzyme
LMDTAFKLGRRFRALKLWMVIRAFGAEGLAARLRQQMEMARDFAAGWTPLPTGSGSRRCPSRSCASAIAP